MEKTRYHDDFIEYYNRAKKLNLRNIGVLPPDTLSGDPLQDNVTIYDTVWRRYAGFSKVLEQLYYGPDSWTQIKSEEAYGRDWMKMNEWLYACLVHRITGSGASFESDHGYRNTAVIEMVECNYDQGIDSMSEFLKYYDKPMFTSIGNQIPPFNKPSPGWDKGGREFLCVHAPVLAQEMTNYLRQHKNSIGAPIGIKPMTEIVLDWMTAHGFKRYKFVLTCWVMDMAEYYPDHVDQKSHCDMGKNAFRSLDLVYDRGSVPKKDFYDLAMDELCETLNNKPFNLEDVLCDVIRYWANYIPKNYTGYWENISSIERISLN